MLKKFISALLAVVIVLSMFTTMTVSATEESSDSTVDILSDNLAVEGENSFGNLLSDAIAPQVGETKNSQCGVTDLEFDGKTANVEYHTQYDCTIVVALYDEETKQMLASGKISASKDLTQASVNIQTEVMPEYFKAKAFMLDENNKPISSVYETSMYTKAIQEVKRMKATDFEEDRVLNLDESDETNFAVYSDNTKVIEYQENYNIPVSVDEENGVYVFSNADESLTTLVQGDVFSYECSDGTVILVKVESISIDGDTVTITDSDTALEDVFDYVKVEATQDMGSSEVGAGDLAGGNPAVNNKLLKASLSKEYEYPISEEFVKGTVHVKFTASVDAYINKDDSAIDFTLGYEAGYKVSIGVEKEVVIEKTPITINLTAGVSVSFTPKFVFSASAEFSIDLKMVGQIGFGFSTDSGFYNLSWGPKTESEVSLEGKVFVGFEIEPSIDLIHRKIARAGVAVRCGLALNGKLNTNSVDGNVQHDCKTCLAGDVSLELTVKANVTLLNDPKKQYEKDVYEGSYKFTDFYYSFDYDEFGWSLCPHMTYSVDIYVTKEGKPYESAEVWLYKDAYAEKAGVTDSKGKLTVKLPFGVYTADVDGELVSFVAYEDTEKVEINIVEKTEPATQPATEPVTEVPTEPMPAIVSSGTCGDNVTWILYENGLLSITGIGDMYDYRKNDWKRYEKLAKSVVIGQGVTGIGEYAFYDCENISEITISDSVTSIGKYAFGYCTSLAETVIPDSVTSIGAYAFEFCKSLETIKIPDSLISIEDHTFYYSGLKKLTIPNNVKSIKRYAFDGCTSLTQITLPNSITSIEEYVFSNCESLVSVKIPDSVTNIGNGAFYRCSSLISIKIPDGVKSIGNSAFGYCRTLLEAIIPNSVTSIGVNVFDGCIYLKKIVIPDGVTRIENSTFANCSNLKEITIPDSVTSIGDSAFVKCTSLKEIIIPDSVTSIGSYTFSGCSLLASIDIPDSVKSIGMETFAKCLRLKEITLSNSITNIGTNLFYGCRDLSKITIPDSVTSIGKNAFYDCPNLTNVLIPESVNDIGVGAFAKCTGLSEITISDGVKNIQESAFSGCTSLTKIYIPSSVISVGDRAFDSCGGLSEIIISDGVTSIGSYAFTYCRNLTEVKIPDSVTSIGTYAFSYCSSLVGIIIPSSIKEINEGTFNNCTGLISVNIPDSVISIGLGAFSRCTNLTDVVIPNSVVSIGDSVFSHCSSLVKIAIPDSVTSIGNSAFGYCENLKEIIIPESVISLGKNIFLNADSLEEIKVDVNNKVYVSVDGVLFDKTLQKLISYPCGRKNTSYTILDSVVSIEDWAFTQCTNLKEIVIPNSVTNIGEAAFSFCEALTEVIIPSGVTSIGRTTFGYCYNLEKITIPKGITSIGNNAFARCYKLTEVVIPESVTRINEYAFSQCYGLTEMTIPDSVETIDYAAFYDCINLKDIYIYGNPAIASGAFPQTATIHYMNTESVSASLATSGLIGSAKENVAEFDGLIAGEDYIVAVVKTEEAEDLLSADNLLYIDQLTADENGNVSLDYVPRESVDNSVALIFGATRTSVSDAEVTAIKDEGSQTVEYTVTLNGVVLKENTDYELVADGNSVTITGINRYKESVTIAVEPKLIGDVNQDNTININDTTLIMKYLAKIESFDENQKLVADTNGDGVISIADATQVQKYLAQMITSFK